MTDKPRNSLQQEWTTLHNNVERSEALALLVKLFAVLTCLVGFVATVDLIIIDLLLLVLWLQEAIWKTFQSRTEQRLLVIEKALSDNDHDCILNYYSHWADSRPALPAMVLQYLSNAIRPTVAYPYVVLLAISFFIQVSGL